MSVAEDMQAAIGHFQAGRLDRAENYCRRVLRREAAHADALHLLGVLEFNRGRPAEALPIFERVIRLLGGFAQAHVNLGNARNATGDYAGAEESYRRAVELDPTDPAPALNLALLRNARGDFPGAEAAARAALRAGPGVAEIHIALAIALHGQRCLADAEKEMRQALALEPNRAGTHSDLGTLLAEMGRFEEAVDRHRRALGLEPNRAPFHGALGATLAQAGNLDGAQEAFAHMIFLAPEDPAPWLARGAALAGLGRFDEATDCYRRAHKLEPERAEVHWHLASINALDVDTTTEVVLSGLLAEQIQPPLNRVHAGFALARLRQSAGRHDEAFAAAQAANTLLAEFRAATMGEHFDSDAFDAEITRTISLTPPDLYPSLAAWADPTDLPVFLVGMPRAGITLVQQILSRHPQVHIAGATQRLPAIDRILSDANRGKPFAEWDAALASRLAGEHTALLAAMAQGRACVVDSTPDNILEVGLLAALFPNARIVHVTRDARDTAIENFFQLTPGGNAWSRDLAQCARRIAGLDRLAAHWRQLPPRQHTLSYEALVTDPEAESRKLIAFLGLNWTPDCLQPELSTAPVTTQSAWQVRQPITTALIGAAAPYARHL